MIALPTDLCDDAPPAAPSPAASGPAGAGVGGALSLWSAFLRTPGPETPRERRARRAVEALLACALVASTAIALVREGDPPRRDSGPGAPLATRTFRSVPIDLARDPPWILRLLPGVGPTRAAAIVRDREANGPLPSVAALVRVPGFGERTAASAAAAGAIASAPGPP